MERSTTTGGRKTTCAHRACDCPVGPDADDPFCSPACRELATHAENSDTWVPDALGMSVDGPPVCGCGHPRCSASPARVR